MTTPKLVRDTSLADALIDAERWLRVLPKEDWHPWLNDLAHRAIGLGSAYAASAEITKAAVTVISAHHNAR